MYEVNIAGKKRDLYVRREALRGIIFGPIYSMIMIFLTYVSTSRWIAFFYVVCPFLLILMIFLFIYAPIKMLKRHNKTIEEISFEESKIVFEVFSALWLKSRKIKLSRDQFEAKETIFNWYGKEKKKGVIIRLINNKEYYLVSDFFNESEYIIKNLIPNYRESEAAPVGGDS